MDDTEKMMLCYVNLELVVEKTQWQGSSVLSLSIIDIGLRGIGSRACETFQEMET